MLRYQIIPVTPFQQNCTVFWNEETKKGGIVDPGGDLELLNKFIDEQGIEIEKILVTCSENTCYTKNKHNPEDQACH